MGAEIRKQYEAAGIMTCSDHEHFLRELDEDYAVAYAAVFTIRNRAGNSLSSYVRVKYSVQASSSDGKLPWVTVIKEKQLVNEADRQKDSYVSCILEVLKGASWPADWTEKGKILDALCTAPSTGINSIDTVDSDYEVSAFMDGVTYVNVSEMKTAARYPEVLQVV